MDDTSRAAGRALPFARILVTGADGFVGRSLIPALAARLRPDARLFLATRRSTALRDDGYTRLAFDLEEPASVAAAIEASRPDLVVHLAGQASVGRAAGAAAATWSLNLGGSLALARALAAAAPDCTMMFASSAEVYGLTFNDGAATETSPLRPLSIYGRSKAAAEAMLADVLPATSRLIVARACNHSGPGQSEDYVIPAFAAQIARAERGGARTIRVGNLDAARDFLDVRDVVAAYLTVLAGAATLPPRSVFNIASQRTVRIGAILDRLRAMSSIDTRVEPDPDRMRPSEIAVAEIDAAAITRAFGWAPVQPLDELLARVLAACRAAAETA